MSLPRNNSHYQGIALFALSGIITRFSAPIISSFRSLANNKPGTIKRGSVALAARHPLVAGQSEAQQSVANREYWLDAARLDEHAFLENVLGDEAIDWVKQRNADALAFVGTPQDNDMYRRILSILDSNDKIPYLTKINEHYYNFWQDEQHTRGILRRIESLDSYCSSCPAWELVLDLDALGAEEGESWVYKGFSLHQPDRPPQAASAPRICRVMIKLSRGGADAVVVREFDLDTKGFVPPDSRAFVLPEAKSRIVWLDADTLLVGIGTDSGEGEGAGQGGEAVQLQKGQGRADLTDSGYPRTVRLWRRGTPLREAPVIFEGEQTDVSVYMYISMHKQHKYALRGRAVTFYTSVNDVFLPHSSPSQQQQQWKSLGEEEGEWHRLDVPLDAEVSVFADQLLIQLRSDWTLPSALTCTPDSSSGSSSGSSRDRGPGLCFKQGTLLATPLEAFVLNRRQAAFTVLFEPSATVSLESYTALRDFVVLETLEVVKSRYRFWRYQDPSDAASAGGAGAGGWVDCGQEETAAIRGSSLSAVDSDESNEYWLTTSSFLKPTTLQVGDASLGPEGVARVRLLRSLPAQFHADGLEERQFQATSADGTKVPYFLIAPCGLRLDGSAPTLLYGYGGFEISLTPSYASIVGAAWLTNSTDSTGAGAGRTGPSGACYVMANIRGGGEFGPAWHQAALRENRKLAYDDFIAVAEDLVRRGVTSPSRLGIRGGSNGGLLMGNMLVRRPDLFAAVCCAVPLLDMRRYSHLLAGASWMAEYGDPDVPEDWAFLRRYSAYHNIDAAAVRSNKYPSLLMTTSTRDDRVHPYHARSFVKRLLDCKDSTATSTTTSTSTTSTTTACVSPSTAPRGTGGGSGVEGGKGGVFYYENMEGGHGGAADNKQQAFMSVLYLEFLKKTICK